MPNAGIQAWRSTNWKSALAALKRLHSSSVSANTSSDTISAIRRANGALRSSSPRTADLPQPALRHDPDRLHDRRVVDLVDVILVQQDAPHAAQPVGDAIRRAAVPQEEIGRDTDPGDRDQARRDHQRPLETVVGG